MQMTSEFVMLKFTFSEKATKIDKIFTVYLTVCSNVVKSAVKISSIIVAFLENMNFKDKRKKLTYGSSGQIYFVCFMEELRKP